MSYEYVDEKRSTDPHALPDVEVFYAESFLTPDDPNWELCGLTGPGWYFAYGFPGCLWDSEPCGPYTTHEEALAEAREMAGVYDDDD